MSHEQPPLVVITTNEERVLPDAFVRRCLVLHLELPKERTELIARLMERGAGHFPRCDETILRLAAEKVADDRKDSKRLTCPPGQAEFLDLVRAVTTLADTPKAQDELLKEVAVYFLQKHPDEER